MKANACLYYVYDPMCSWCWGYKPVWDKIESELSDELPINYLLGGLAPDSDVPMPTEMQQQIAGYWRKISDLLGTQFNFDFWENNTPKRSTYPACRAILAARYQGAEKKMLEAIQRAYYLEAKNPSEIPILISLAANIGLDMEKFKKEFSCQNTAKKLLNEISFARSIGGNSFPSLFVESNGEINQITVNYQDPKPTIDKIRQLL